MNCLIWLLLLALGFFVVLTMIRWFEQITEAVDLGWWNKTLLLMVVPFAVWFFPSRVAAGRPTPVPVHTPVRGFGTAPKPPPAAAEPSPPVRQGPRQAPRQVAAGPSAPASPEAAPPPGTPAEFLENPGLVAKGQPKPPPRKPAVEPDKIEKLRQKMREQGMLDDE